MSSYGFYLSLAAALYTPLLATALNLPPAIISLDPPQPRPGTFTLPTDLLPTPNNFSLTATQIICYTPTTKPQYHPIVLEDCYKPFSDIFLNPRLLTTLVFTPSTSRYRRQNGNCIFTMNPGPNAVVRDFNEVQIGASLAKIVKQCVTAGTGYFGGEQMLFVESGWVVSVKAAGSRE
jgi:hypothetical protein